MEITASYCACSPASLHGNQALKVKRWTIGGLCWVTRKSNPCSHICHYFPQSVTCFSLLSVLFSLAEDGHGEADPPRLSSKGTSCCDRAVCPKKSIPFSNLLPDSFQIKLPKRSLKTARRLLRRRCGFKRALPGSPWNRRARTFQQYVSDSQSISNIDSLRPRSSETRREGETSVWRERLASLLWEIIQTNNHIFFIWNILRSTVGFLCTSFN